MSDPFATVVRPKDTSGRGPAVSSTVTAPDSHAIPCASGRRHKRWCSSRRVATAEAIALLLVAIALVFATLATRGSASDGVASQSIRVEHGQTLWALAEQHPMFGLTTEQTAQLIASINHLDARCLAAGSTIRVPARLADYPAVAWR
jgi:LysM domain